MTLLNIIKRIPIGGSMENDYRFTALKTIFCKECKRDALHETGMNTKTKDKVAKCIKCDTITIYKK